MCYDSGKRGSLPGLGIRTMRASPMDGGGVAESKNVGVESLQFGSEDFVKLCVEF